MSTCRSCGAEILWVRSAKNGTLMPLDAVPDPNGNVELDDDGHAVVHGQADMLGGQRFMPHHATCPHADQWRR